MTFQAPAASLSGSLITLLSALPVVNRKCASALVDRRSARRSNAVAPEWPNRFRHCQLLLAR